MKSHSGMLGWLGVVAIVFGLLSLALQLFSGGIFLGADLPWIWANFLIGLGLLGVALFNNLDELRERMRSGEARRAGKYGTSAVVSTGLAIALLALLAFLSTRYHARFDWTESRTHSLSDQTRKILAGLEDDVRVTAFYSAVAAIRARDLLERYEYESDRFEVEFVDPQARPGVSRRLGVEDQKLSGGLVHVAIGGEAVEVEEPSEETITNALVKLTRLEQKLVYFIEGHGERPVSGDGADGEGGFAFAADALANENYRFETLLLAAKGDVPDDANVVVIAGPTRPFHEAEREGLRRYVARGGALLVLVDPRANTDLYELLEAWGVLVGEDVIVDRLQGLFGRPFSPFAAQYAAHPITQGLREATLFHEARSVRTRPEFEGDFTVLVHTSQESWAERDLELLFGERRAEKGPEDLAGPVPVALAGEVPLESSSDGAEPPSEGEAAPGRLVVIGDADFAANALIREFRNRDLFVNAVNWLLGDVEAIAIRPSLPRASRLQLSTDQFMQIRYLSLFVLPETLAVIGVFAWWFRRRAPGR